MGILGLRLANIGLTLNLWTSVVDADHRPPVHVHRVCLPDPTALFPLRPTQFFHHASGKPPRLSAAPQRRIGSLSHRQAGTNRVSWHLQPQRNQEKQMKPTNPLNDPPSKPVPVDEDLAEQANPGHGVPSQDPSGAAQTLLKPHEAKREADSVLVGGGLVAGATAGVVAGVAVAGPVGIVAGAALGAVAGALGGAAAGAAASPEEPERADTAPADQARRPKDGS
jgi:hypothetical protein